LLKKIIRVISTNLVKYPKMQKSISYKGNIVFQKHKIVGGEHEK